MHRHQPAVFAGVRPRSRLEQEEVFGPVLAALRFRALDEAIRINNDVGYGLSAALTTRDILKAHRAIADIDAGISCVDAPTIGAEAHLPFGGAKETGDGHREGGRRVYDLFSETRTVYVDCSGVLQRAQIDTHDVRDRSSSGSAREAGTTPPSHCDLPSSRPLRARRGPATLPLDACRA